MPATGLAPRTQAISVYDITHSFEQQSGEASHKRNTATRFDAKDCMLPFDKTLGKQEDDRWTEQLSTSKNKLDLQRRNAEDDFGNKCHLRLQRDRPYFHTSVFVHESMITMGNLDEVDFGAADTLHPWLISMHK